MSRARAAKRDRTREALPLCLLFCAFLAPGLAALTVEASLPKTDLDVAVLAAQPQPDPEGSARFLPAIPETHFSLLAPPELASRAYDAGPGFHLELQDFGPNLQRGPPLAIPDLHQGWFVADPKTRIGGFRLELEDLIGGESSLSLRSQRGCLVGGWKGAEGEPPDPWGLQQAPVSKELELLARMSRIKAEQAEAEKASVWSDFWSGVGKTVASPYRSWSGKAYAVKHAAGDAAADAWRVEGRPSDVQLAAGDDRWKIAPQIGKAVGDISREGAEGTAEIGRFIAEGKAIEFGVYGFGAVISKMGSHYKGYQGNVWALGSGPRGYVIEGRLDIRGILSGRLPPNFKTIDFFDEATGIVTSVKSLEATLPGYTNKPESIFRAIRGYVDKLKAFEGAQSLKYDKVVRPEQISGRSLYLAIPSQPLTSSQRLAIEKGSAYARNLGIDIQIFTAR